MDEPVENGKLMTRRDFLAWLGAAAAAVTLSGCTLENDSTYYDPAPKKRPRSYTAYAQTPPPQGAQQPQYIYVQQQPQQVVATQPRRTVQTGGGKVSAMSRNSWGATAAVPAKMKAMNGVTRITVHHEGSGKGNSDTSPAAVAKTLQLIQSQHRKRMGAGDIGYHFIIDRTGVIWQGRDWKYQGAHTSGANSNNIGIMLLGNFEFQQPSSAQLNSLSGLTASLARKYGLSRSDVYGHSDFCKTQCPGKNLKPYVVSMKKTLAI